MKVLPLLLVLCIICMSNTSINTSVEASIETTLKKEVQRPRVFIIHENELLFDELGREYETLMLAACDNDIKKAEREWSRMLVEMQRYAALWNYYDELKGVKIWLKVFCNKRGRIQHIAYALKPSSKAIDTELFSRFLERFMQIHRMNIRSKSKYSNYTSVSFPLKKR